MAISQIFIHFVLYVLNYAMSATMNKLLDVHTIIAVK